MGGDLVPYGVDVQAQRDLEIDALKRQIRDLTRGKADAERQAERAAEDAQRAMSMLRQQLGPLYRALQAVFGELDAAGVSEPSSPERPAASPQSSAVWESWKQKLGKGPAKCIDALLTHKELNTTQLSIATGYHRNNIPSFVHQLNKAGLIDKNGGRFSLKALP